MFLYFNLIFSSIKIAEHKSAVFSPRSSEVTAGRCSDSEILQSTGGKQFLKTSYSCSKSENRWDE
jgi:ribosomal protein S27E